MHSEVTLSICPNTTSCAKLLKSSLHPSRSINLSCFKLTGSLIKPGTQTVLSSVDCFHQLCGQFHSKFSVLPLWHNLADSALFYPAFPPSLLEFNEWVYNGFLSYWHWHQFDCSVFALSLAISVHPIRHIGVDIRQISRFLGQIFIIDENKLVLKPK